MDGDRSLWCRDLSRNNAVAFATQDLDMIQLAFRCLNGVRLLGGWVDR